MHALAYLKDLLKDAGTVLTAAVCGLVGISWFGFPGLAIGVIGGAGLGTWLFKESSRVKYLERRVAELEAERDRTEPI